MKADLHTHSRCSDGSLTIEELVEAAAGQGLDALSITDHDTTRSLERAKAAGKHFGITVIPGVEISAYDPDTQRKIHILGYGMNGTASHIDLLCTPVLKARHANTLRQIQAIKEAGFELTEQEVFREAGEAEVLYKQHIMAVLVNKGYAERIYDPLYHRLFKNEGVAAGDISYPHYREAIQAVLADDGVPVLAHPGQQSCLDLIPDLVQEGLKGVEINHADNTALVREKIAALASEYGLHLTGGSDFHGCYGESEPLGSELAPGSFILLAFSDRLRA